MFRWLAPLAGVIGLVLLVVGLVWAEFAVRTTGGVGLVGFGVLALLTGVVVVALHELPGRRHRG